MDQYQVQVEQTEAIRKTMLFYLTLYPRVNKGFFNHILLPWKSADWQPVFKTMVEDGTLLLYSIASESPKGHIRTYEIITLADQNSVVQLDQLAVAHLVKTDEVEATTES